LGLGQGELEPTETPWDRRIAIVGLPNQHLIGSGLELSENLVMTVRISAGMPEEDQDFEVPLYWRALTYDRYTGRGWRSSPTEIEAYPAGELLVREDEPFLWAIQQDYRFAQKNDKFLYAAGMLVTSNHEFEVAWRTFPGEVSAFGDALGAKTEAVNYQVQSLVSAAGESDLRKAPDIYPGWVTVRYLRLPDDLPQRVIDLAQEWVAGIENPYDRALALEARLRAYPYTLDVPTPPIGRDVVEYFLFDLGEGYCDYYATSMVVMARVVGLPARVAIGYARGTYDPNAEWYLVTEADAHSWVEIYFPGVGWVPFEPTGGLPEIGRKAQSAVPPKSVSKTLVGPLRMRVWLQTWRWHLIVGSLLFGILFVRFGYQRFDQRRLRQLAPKATLRKLYQRFYRQGRWLAAPARSSDTPHEYVAALWGVLSTLLARPRWMNVRRDAEAEIHELTSLYTQALYSPRAAGIDSQLQGISLWYSLRRRLWLARVLHILVRVANRFR
jgi:transglutaminase-like putative cysteine protease